MPKEELEISWKTLSRILFFAVLAASVYFFRDLIAIFLSAVIIATVVEGPVTRLMRRGWPRFAAVATIYLGTLLVVAALIYFIVPMVIYELLGASNSFLVSLNKVAVSNPLFSNFVGNLENNASQHFQDITASVEKTYNVLFGIAQGLLSLILVFVTSFYLAVQGRAIERLINIFVPDDYQDYFLSLWARSQRKIGRWFYAQVMLSIFVAVPVFFGLWFLGVRYALLLGICAAIFEIIPVVGPIMSAALSALLAVHQGFDTVIYVILLFVIIQQIESQLFVPTVMKRSIGLNPVVVLFALLVGGKLAGLWGVVLAVPFTGALSELLEDWEKGKILKSRRTE